MIGFRIVSFGLLLAVAPALSSSGQVDQAFLPTEPINGALNTWFDVRQEFTPTLDRMDSIQLFLGSFDLFANSYTVVVREGGVTGPVIGTSSRLDLPPQFSGPAVFVFPSPVHLHPGEIYAFEPVLLEGNGNLIETDSVFYRYPGRTYYDGSFSSLGFPNPDVFFAEGIGIPEPVPWLLFSLGAALGLCRRAMRA